MKKRIISLLLSLILILTSVCLLVGCNKEKKFTVIFDMGKQYDNIRVAKGYEDIPLEQTVSSYKELKEPLFVCDEAYHVGWNDILKNINRDTTLTAVWSNKPLVIEFEPGAIDATLESGRESFVTNAPSKITPPLYSRPGYTMDETYGGINFDTLKENTVITAKWIPNKYNIIFEEIDGQNPTFTNTDNLLINQDNRYYKQVTFSEEIGNLPTPINANGKKFAGWLVHGTSLVMLGEMPYQIPSDAIIDAVWIEDNQYVLAYQNVGMVDNPIFYTLNEKSFKLNKPTKTGYEFIGWTYEGQETPQIDVTIDTSLQKTQTFIANWKVKTYTITLDPLSGGVVDKSNITVTFGQRVGELPIATREGYEFVGWTTSNKTKVNKNTVWNIDDGSIKLEAKYKRIYTVKFVFKCITEGIEVICNLVPRSYEGYTLTKSVDEENTYVWANVREDTRIEDLPDAVVVSDSEEYTFVSWKYRIDNKKTVTVKPGAIIGEQNFKGSRDGGVIVIYAYCYNNWSPYF